MWTALLHRRLRLLHKPARRASVAAVLLLASLHGADAADLTDTEVRWLNAATPVLTYAQQQQLPIDIVVQPQNAPDAPPLRVAFLEGRCKFVLTMRGNAAPARTLSGLPTDLQDAAVEMMAAHEIAHCWRHTQGHWHALPAGFDETPDATTLDERTAKLLKDMREARREEGYADLVGLAWTLRQHPAHYDRLRAWLSAFRDHPALAGDEHDTRAWLKLATERARFTDEGSVFVQAVSLWKDGLLAPIEAR